MTETLAYGYSSDSIQLELSNVYQQDRVQIQTSLRPCFYDESSLSIERDIETKSVEDIRVILKKHCLVFVLLLINIYHTNTFYKKIWINRYPEQSLF